MKRATKTSSRSDLVNVKTYSKVPSKKKAKAKPKAKTMTKKEVIAKAKAAKPTDPNIKRPGALTEAVGGKPSKNMKKVRKLAKDGTTLQKQQANYYINYLHTLNKYYYINKIIK